LGESFLEKMESGKSFFGKKYGKISHGWYKAPKIFYGVEESKKEEFIVIVVIYHHPHHLEKKKSSGKGHDCQQTYYERT